MKKSKPSIWFLCVCHREVSEWGRPEEHGQPEQDYSGHVAAKSWALLLWWGGKLRLPVWVLRQRQRLLGHEVTFLCDFCVFATFFFLNVPSGLYLLFLSTVSQLWYADSVLATRLMSASCSFPQHPATGFLVCQLPLWCRLHPNQQRQRAALKLQGSSPQPPPTSPQAMVSITT